MQFTFRIQAEEHEVFSENAFDGQIGTIVPVNFRDTEDGPVVASMGEARLMGVAILENGKVAELTLEPLKSDADVAASTAESLLKAAGPMSFSVKEP